MNEAPPRVQARPPPELALPPEPFPLPDGVLLPVASRLGATHLALARAVTHGATRLEALDFQALTGAHVRRAPEDWRDNDRVFEFAGQLTGLPPSVFDQLVGLDIGEVIRTTLGVAWPMLDLPVQWEATWKDEAETRGRAPRELPKFPGGFALALDTPLANGRDAFSTLTFSELTGKIARACPMGGLPVSRLPWLVEELTGAPRAIVDQLSGRDLNRALALAQLFFLGYPSDFRTAWVILAARLGFGPEVLDRLPSSELLAWLESLEHLEELQARRSR